MSKKNKEITKAVALSYSPEINDAPILKAKGKGNIAEQIIEKATSHQIPIQEDASLVEVLSMLEINDEIPADLYQLVSEILSIVYEADQKAKLMEVFK
ncbi:EscU/YscU/HrcU family type III secretion system export apparatus switch protein [Chengkuizengella axinellae]|uniref:EscU/YscU/HrcU family type III secretion system export apparatus switch protein n=1 Tax=Chengkuizengella axinellae TaxID=3064388 RepID=A0ABT9IWE6_9BACL|nr:EscU/YscU/HrcU family type III secretion system export apparatus switch protein [Chengkuizengella sp. 2205SS18-9]MDP5273422.1 EscU/YscU/HrcU family type III secretion system export apparatus switch protein [Chengkuizengella sp. 2205SS18-9]